MTSHSEDDNLPLEEAKWKKGVVIMKKIIRARSEGRKLDVMYLFDPLISFTFQKNNMCLFMILGFMECKRSTN